jgi:hypothetical protein
VLEELYHNTLLLQVGIPSDLNLILEKRLEEYPNWIRDDKDALSIALERLEGEINNDKELDNFLPPGIDLGKQVRDFKKNLRLSTHKL